MTTFSRRLARWLVTLIALCLSATEAQAQRLTIQGDRFAIDGTPKFLTFISYFGRDGRATCDPGPASDSQPRLRWIRIWPNLDTVPN